MKTMKKLLAVILAMTLTMAMGICASASSQGGGDGDGTNAAPKGSITVTNAIVGETYTLYKVFDATVSDGREHDSTGISYTSKWFTESNKWFDVDSRGNITITEAGTGTDGKLSDGAIEFLKDQISNFTQIGQPIKATSATVTWGNLDPGYYYISTTTGSFISVDSITPNVEVEDKNSLPSHDKKQATAANGIFGDDLLELNIGDTVYYQTEIKIGKGSDKDITLTDTMTSGLTLNHGEGQITVTLDGVPVDSEKYELTSVTDQGFTLTLKESYVSELNKDNVIIVAYSAVINKDAVIDSATGNYNEAKLKYSKQEATDTVYVATYDFLLKKTDGNKYLPGSGFKIYDAATEGNQICVAKDTGSDRYYVDQSATKDPAVQILVDNENGVNVRGLKPGTYYLEETKTPDGYNTLTKRQSFTITSGATSAKEVIVENHAGAELPSTGGRGTTLLYAIGAALVIGAAVLLIARRRTEQ